MTSRSALAIVLLASHFVWTAEAPPAAPPTEPLPALAAPAAGPLPADPATAAAPALAPTLSEATPSVPATLTEVPPEGNLDSELRLNFQAAPIDTVLDYLSRAAGFIIVRDAPVAGTIDIVSHTPLSADDAVAMLHNVLSDRGYGVIRTDRVLRVIRRDDARNRDLPVVSGNDPELVPRTGELVTQIVPLRHTTAAKLIETLKPLLPAQITISANEDSNALVVTDTRVNIRRMLEIIKALDTAVSSILDIGVIPLRCADAVETAEVINKVYETPTAKSSSQSNSGASGRGGFFARMPGFGGPDGGGDSTSARTPEGSREAKQTASFVRAVADQRGNAVVVTAATEILAQVRQLVEQLDIPTEDVTTVRVLPLRYATATEVANLLASLYPDSTSSSSRQSSRFSGPFFGPGAMMMGGGQAQPSSSSTQSQRKLSEAKVIAVADTRTNAVIVSASTATMDEIAEVVKELDATPANVPTVYVYQLQNADVTRTKEILDNMFEDLDSSTSNSSSSNRSRTTTTRSASGTAATNQTGSQNSSFSPMGSR